MTTDEKSVLEANNAFYRAFSSQDVDRMEKMWSASHEVAVIHPGWPPLTGRHSVVSSWKRIMEGGMSPKVSCVNARANILGDMAIVICTELLTEVELVATNIFILEQGEWKMIHHQAGPLPATGKIDESDTLH